MTVLRLRRSPFSYGAATILACFGPKPITAQHGWVVVRHAVMLRQHRMQRLKVLSKTCKGDLPSARVTAHITPLSPLHHMLQL